jgi:hypothetical protein
MKDPKPAPKLPLNPEIFAFMGKAQMKLKEIEDKWSGAGACPLPGGACLPSMRT